MELIEDAEKEKVFQEDDTLYTMLDMGDYIGHRDREWYQKSPERWFLMYMDKKDKSLHIEALVDDIGNYMRFVIENEKIKRVISVNRGRVFNDLIVDKSSSDLLGNSYSVLDGDIYSKEQYPLIDYLQHPLEYNIEGNELSGEIPSLDNISTFLKINEKLSNEIINGSTIKL